jgi:hypothetical protein
MKSGGISTTPIKTSSSNLNNVNDTFTQNTYFGYKEKLDKFITIIKNDN